MRPCPAADVPLSSFTSLQTGGPATWLVEVQSLAELPHWRSWAHKRELPLTIIGGGTNILVADEGVPGLVLRMANRGITSTHDTDQTVLVRCAAGELFDDVVAQTVACEWWGLENLSHIPGTVGATPIQNVGAYGVEVSELVESVEVFAVDTGETRILSRSECRFGYRDSYFKTAAGKGYIITAVTFRLHKQPRPRLQYMDLATRFATSAQQTLTPADIRAEVCQIRAGKFPDWHTLGTAGSFFKNPIVPTEVAQSLREQHPELPVYELGQGKSKLALGWILDKLCGLRGYREGAVGLYQQQALVLVQYGGATSAAIDAFATMVEERVYTNTGICIEREVTQLPK